MKEHVAHVTLYCCKHKHFYHSKKKYESWENLISDRLISVSGQHSLFDAKNILLDLKERKKRLPHHVKSLFCSVELKYRRANHIGIRDF